MSCIRKMRISQYTQHLARYIESSLPSTIIACAACRLRGIKLGNFDFCSSPLQLGSLRGNAFRILMRDVDTHDEDHVSFTITPSVDPAPDRRFCMGIRGPPLVPQIHWQCSPPDAKRGGQALLVDHTLMYIGVSVNICPTGYDTPG